MNVFAMTEQATSIPYVRRKRILDLLSQSDIITMDELLKQLAPVSKSTVRRDVLQLQAENMVEMLRGGAVKLTAAENVELPVAEKLTLHTEEKLRIAQYAAALVQDGETIYIDSGTTTSLMTRFLREKEIVIITSSIQVIAEAHLLRATVLALGGEINKSIGSICGPVTDQQLQEIFLDKAFVGASGFNLDSGVTTFDMREASKKRIVQQNTRVTYVLADSSKAGKNTLCRAFPLSECILVTDAENIITSQNNALVVE